MRFSTSIISLLALATSSLAMPAKRALPLQIRNFSVVDHSDVAYRSIQFSVTDPNTNVSEDCNLGWYVKTFPPILVVTLPSLLSILILNLGILIMHLGCTR